MPMFGLSRGLVKHRSVRERVDQKIIGLSMQIGLAAAVITLLVECVGGYREINRWKGANLRALSEVNCVGSKCDTSEFLRDQSSAGSDYVLDTRTRYFINTPTPTEETPAHFLPLEFVDAAFFRQFSNPRSFLSPDGETWRLHSKEVAKGSQRFEIVVGHQQKAPLKMFETPAYLIGVVDEKLEQEADQIADMLPALPAAMHRGAGPADGLLIIDGKSNRVVEWGAWLPQFLPAGVRIPSPGIQPFVYEGDVYALETDSDGRIVASSMILIGSFAWIVGSGAIAFVVVALATRVVATRYLRPYLAIRNGEIPSLEEALRIGEGQTVEFKRAVSVDEAKSSNVDDEILKSVAAFANTNDGAIFIGVDDAGRVKGLELSFKQRDNLEQRILQLVRNKIKPNPPVQVVFQNFSGLVVAKIAVAKGDETVYIMSGVIYLRQGSSDRQAAPEDLRRVLQYAY